MSIMELIKKRHSIRRFKPELITDAELDQIIEAGRHAPSGHNQQLTHFVVIQKPEILEELQRKIVACFAAMETPAKEDPFYTPITKSKANAYPCMYNAPTFIIVSNSRTANNAMADSSLAMENMMLMATEIGVGTCWINQVRWLQSDETMMDYLETLGIPRDEIVCASLAVGYANQPVLPPTVIKNNRVDYIK